MLFSNLAIIILNYNTPKLTEVAVNSLLKIEEGLSIIIVDNSSTDNSFEYLTNVFSKNKNVYLIESKCNGGYAKGNNIGLRFAENINGIDSIGIMNPDVVIDRESLRLVFESLINDSVGLATARTIYCGKRSEINECAWKFGTLLRWVIDVTIIGAFIRRVLKNGKFVDYFKYGYDRKYYNNLLVPVDVVQGCFFLTKIKTMKEINGFDENTFLYYEEYILSKKIKSVGKGNFVVTNAWIEHNHKNKNDNLKNKKNKLFHMTCEFNSRKYYFLNYTKYNSLIKKILLFIWRLDFLLRKMIVSIGGK